MTVSVGVPDTDGLCDAVKLDEGDSDSLGAWLTVAAWLAVDVPETLAVRVDVMDAEGVSVRVGVAEQPRLAAKSAAARTLDADRTVHAGLLPLLRTRAVV